MPEVVSSVLAASITTGPDLQYIIAATFPLAIASARKEKFALTCEELMVSPLEKLLGTWA